MRRAASERLAIKEDDAARGRYLDHSLHDVCGYRRATCLGTTTPCSALIDDEQPLLVADGAVSTWLLLPGLGQTKQKRRDRP